MSDVLQLDPSATINEIVAHHPETIAVFNRLGFDTCCGGSMSVEEAARRDGADLESVIAELRHAVERR